MRTIPRATTALVCLLTAAALAGCGAGDGAAEKSAADLLDEANDTMRALSSVTVDMSNTPDKDRNGTVTMRLKTDLKDRCTAKTTWAENGSLEQIRIGETDDKADKEGTYTFYVATEGEPYLLRTVYKGGGNVTATSFSGFDEPLEVRPPAAGQVLDKADVEQ